MNSEQKDKLLKLAENNPDLAKDVVDILKADTEKSVAPETPVAVKIVKDEADKIVITDEQKTSAKIGVGLFIVSFLSLTLGVIYPITSMLLFKRTPSGFVFFTLLFSAVSFGIISDLLIAKNIGYPIFKKYLSRNFKFS